jgi:general secretion pathway protein A
MYKRYFGLRENPFALPPDPRYLYLSLRYQEALAHLMYGITQGGGFVQLTGEVGTGKTMMIRSLLDRLPLDVNVALVLYPLLSVEEFVLAVCDDLRVPRPENPASLKNIIDTLNRYLLERHAQGQRTVIIIDEAHKLSHEVLEQVRLLTNLETTKEKLLQMLLVGQPELASLLAQPDLRQLAQRITARYNLTPLLPRETAEYVMRRLRVAGAQNPIFTPGALSTVHRLSGGTPRLINTICDRALLGAYGRGKNRVTSGMVRRAAGEIGHVLPRRFGYLQRAGIVAGIAGLVAVGIWQLSNYRPEPLQAVEVAAASTAPVEPPPPASPAPTPVTAPAPEPVADEPKPVSLAALLDNRAAVLDTDSAFTALFAKWKKDYNQLAGSTGCQRAEKAKLRCIYGTGTWNNLRELNRPVVIELQGADGQRHQVLVKALKDDNAVLEIAGQAHEFSFAAIERYWYGKYLTLWRPPASGDAALRMGLQGPAVVWLRQALARANGQPVPSRPSVTFDAELAEQVKAFQRRHRLEADGIAGRSTLLHLDAYSTEPSPTLTQARAY